MFEELEVPTLDFSSELALLEAEELGELDFSLLLAGGEEAGGEVPALPEPEIDTSVDVSDLLQDTGDFLKSLGPESPKAP